MLQYYRMDGELTKRAKEVINALDVDRKRKQVRELEAESMKEGFWKDNRHAAHVMKQIADIQKEIEQAEMLALLLEEGDKKELEKEVDRLEFTLFLSGPYDKDNAIVSLHAGQGGTEAMDWTAILYRMYTRYIEKKEWKFEEIDSTPGEEAGIKSVTIQVEGRYAYGMLKAESGVHRLVRQSPFNADNLRQTSFSMVTVLPEIGDVQDVQIHDEELEWDFYRSSGKGGQNVNKVSTAVRLKHLPTGIVVTSQTQRHQGQNREYALKVLRSKLWAKAEEERQKKENKLKGSYVTPGWGNQIRSYVLHPYHMVKDLRTQHETNDTEAVLDGDIEDFIYAYLKK